MGRGIQLKFSIKGAKVVRKGLQNLHKKLPEIGRWNVWQALLRIARKLRIYPGKRAGQNYVRTYKLKRGWEVKKVGATAYMIVNRVPYTHYVVGYARGGGQAWMHVGRWKLFRDQVDDEMKRLPKTIDEDIQRVARESGL